MEMARIVFEVKGSQDEPYQVEFTHREGELLANCTCPAGQFGSICKHRLRLLVGNTDGVIEPDESSVRQVQDWLGSSSLRGVFSEYNEAVAALEAAKRKVSRAKRRLSKMMNGR